MSSRITFPAKLKTYGNSYCIPVPKAYVERLDLKPGDDLDVVVTVPPSERKKKGSGETESPGVEGVWKHHLKRRPRRYGAPGP